MHYLKTSKEYSFFKKKNYFLANKIWIYLLYFFYYDLFMQLNILRYIQGYILYVLAKIIQFSDTCKKTYLLVKTWKIMQNFYWFTISGHTMMLHLSIPRHVLYLLCHAVNSSILTNSNSQHFIILFSRWRM